MLISSLKAKDYDSKISNLQNESASHRSQLIQIEDEIEQLRILWSQREKPQIIEASPPRDNKALQELILLINAQKNTTDRHEQILIALQDADARIESLETQILKLLGLNGRVESLEGLRAEISDLRSALALSERQCKMDRLDLREQIKQQRSENIMEHETINMRIDRTDQLISGLIKLQSEIDRLTQ